ncbi:hypothetical protein SK128_004017, partial [Halocaridina rubra]
MASLRSIKAGLSRSYQSLHTLGNDNETYGRRSADTDWIGVDNFKSGRNGNTSAFSAFKNAMSRVSRSKTSSSKISVILKDLNDEWRIQEEPNEGENFIG